MKWPTGSGRPGAVDREVADREVADREVADREVADREVADREVADREVADHPGRPVDHPSARGHGWPHLAAAAAIPP
jgi:hypothetical protein